MKVQVVECLSGMKRAKGLIVVIDVFRSSTVGCFIVNNGAREYLATERLELAREIAAARNGKVVGERVDVPVREFDYGNSPTLFENLNLEAETLVHSTNAGTRGIVLACAQGDEVLTGSFVNAAAVVKHIRRREPEIVTLVAMGTGGTMRAQEDMMCAMYIKNELEAYPNSFKTLKKFLADVDSSRKFFDEERLDAPESDFDLCMDLDRFDFVLKAEVVQEGCVRLQRIDSDSGEKA
ncbi:2-phosphosulfolactate phosphatase [Pseudodesulfovibrio sp. JC047]|uniref:2-phosphosulfolactate phosphatase n=1 Tax=Pseudodesulfovibrio sp. JC047 TaxID=2683199 RepID=UPI0013D2BB58|nr:2-phosphosulfolactate phosphatase [Pseudodesulfovibrio sp. JC047]NDV18966.1 2-phosphosulfolactate phosphatase [Pseudodesulfovibrio sp. JC047]